jgi:hypothetical protein
MQFRFTAVVSNYFNTVIILKNVSAIFRIYFGFILKSGDETLFTGILYNLPKKYVFKVSGIDRIHTQTGRKSYPFINFSSDSK